MTTHFMPLALRRRIQLDDWCVGLALFFVLYVFELNPRGLFFVSPPIYQHLGAEYYNIAIALVEGRGFSDPFGETTGPTAWMPPFFSVLLAGFLAVLGNRVAVSEAIVFLTVVSLSAVGVMLFRMAKRSASWLSPYAIVGLYVLWLWAFYFWFFFLTHDIWLLTLLVASMAYVIHGHSVDGSWSRWRWALLGSVAALASPSLAVAWFGMSAVLFLTSRALRKDLVVAAALAACATAPWLARNAVQFHEFIPTKSNLFYEAYQANYRYEGGIYDNTWNEHPNVSSRVRFQYAALGEMRFTDEYEQKFRLALEKEPARYVHNVVNRLLAVTVIHPDQGSYDPPPKMVVRRLVYPLPFLGLALGLLLRGPWRLFLVRLATLWGAFMAPYVLVAFYLRYLMPMTPCLMLMAFLGADQLASRIAGRGWVPAQARRNPEPHA